MSTGITKTKKYKLSTERNKALSMFQKIRKLQDSSDGYVKCISCGKFIPVSEADGGHFIPRQYRATELMPTNVNAQCRTCNRFDYGNQIGYEEGLTERYGIKETERLKNFYKAYKGNAEAYNNLSDEDKKLVFRHKSALEYHEAYLEYCKVYKQLKDKEI